VLYLLDANVLITANSLYYPLDQVPEFWSWIQHQSEAGQIKIPLEIMEEIQAGSKNKDPLLDWINDKQRQAALLLNETIDPELVRRVVSDGYAKNLTDEEVEKLGRDPFLLAYGLAHHDRCIVTTEVPKPTATKHNRKIPDVCKTLSLECCGPFQLNKALGFKTSWKKP
jgi:hypothetical protein